MFGFFNRNKRSDCPISEDNRKWIDSAFLWFFEHFDKSRIIDRKVLVPSYDDFPIAYNGTQETAIDTLKIVANQMDVNADDINLDFYFPGLTEFKVGGEFGKTYNLENNRKLGFSAGLYHKHGNILYLNHGFCLWPIIPHIWTFCWNKPPINKIPQGFNIIFTFIVAYFLFASIK